MLAGGQSILLKHGDYEALIVTVGAGMCSVKYKDRYISLPHDPDEVPLAHIGKVLIPWPNRIKNASYEFEGNTYSLAVTEARTGSASHGFLAWKEWQIEEVCEDSLILKAYVIPTVGYPFLLESKAYYKVDDGGLSVTLITKNIGKKFAPYGVGQHPYITCNKEVLDNCTLHFPCSQVWDVDEKMCPTKLIRASQLNLDFDKERSLNGVKIDHAFKNDKDPLVLTLKSDKMEVSVTTKAPYVQLFTAEKLLRKGLAVEPMSCPANAFNSKVGLTVLKPQESHALTYRISAKIFN